MKNPKNIMFKCVLCGGPMIWDSCATANEISDNYEDDDDASVWYFHCSKCGCDYEVFEPNKNERQTTYREYYYDN